MLKTFLVLCLLWWQVGGILGGIAVAQTLEGTHALERLFEQPLETSWFSPTFLQAVPAAQIEQLLGQIQQDLGAYQGVQDLGEGRYRVAFERGTIEAQVDLNATGQFIGLRFRPAGLSPAEAAQAVQDLPGEVSLLIQQDGEVLTQFQSDRPLAVGSAFKLAVLAALQQQIEDGQIAWDQVVPLNPNWKSLPSGLLQDWPDNAPLTIQTLATLMISLSDNTATDALMAAVGQESLQAFRGQNQPLLSTQQAFKLKNPENADLLRQYRAGEREAAVAQLDDRPLPTVELFAADAIAPDVEWFFSAQELCQLMAQVEDLPLMQVNPGLASPQQWSQIAFKGGSEPGVLNFTTTLQDGNRQRYCVVMTVNAAQALPENELALLYERIIEGLIPLR
ncbi:MAG: serine hydrolase [Cyanobacteria bacterium P01_G01_bin.54]